MHIALYHDAIIPPQKYGGTERIIGWLAKALLSLGHKITLIAKEGSHVPGTNFLPLSCDTQPWDSQIPKDCDVVHLWGTPQIPPKRPYLVTIQGNGKPREIFDPNTVFISKKHAENHGSRIFVHNGIDPDEYPCDEKRTDTLVFLAKASWKVKNLPGAIEIAKAAGLRLEVLGSRDYPWPFSFSKKLWIRGVRYRGMVGDAEKKSVLRNARALLFPVRWPEPFGIAVTEALASGCPVFGTPYGSLPELVTEEVGFLSQRADDLIEALLHRIYKPATCRARVYQGLTHLDMAKKYLSLYERLLTHGSIHEDSKIESPRAGFLESSESLLPWESRGFTKNFN